MAKRSLFFLLLTFSVFSPSQSLFSDGLEEKFKEVRSLPGWPLEFFSPISGTFAEYRNYNMHMGADFKSYGMNGHSILATYDGYIDHISQSNKGYGLSLNLYSPEIKIITKYAHLFSFNGKDSRLELLRQSLCMLNGKDSFYTKLPPGLFPVKKGDRIGLTGESGSGISHLHLEFRNESGFINPLYFNAFHTKDRTHPTILKVIWEDSASSSSKELIPIEKKPGSYELADPIIGRGKIRIKLGGYDMIRSRNKNNVFAFQLLQGQDSIYRKEFLFIPYSGSSNRQLFYDTNRSSLSPPVYFYNLYDYTIGHSLDLSSYPEGTKISLVAILEDATGNQSRLPIYVEVGTPIEESPSKITSTKKGMVYTSSDSILNLDFSKNATTGNGSPKLEKTNWEAENVKIPQGLNPTTSPYKISVQNFGWEGEALGFYRTNKPLNSKETLYFYDSSIKRFTYIWSKRTKDGFQFKTTKLGILGIFSDDSPPSVQYSYQISPFIHLPKASIPGIMERTYFLADIGSGYINKPEVFLEGEPYPYEYDTDRHAIRILFPKKAFLEKKYLLLEIRPRDWAGNTGKYFTEVLTSH